MASQQALIPIDRNNAYETILDRLYIHPNSSISTTGTHNSAKPILFDQSNQPLSFLMLNNNMYARNQALRYRNIQLANENRKFTFETPAAKYNIQEELLKYENSIQLAKLVEYRKDLLKSTPQSQSIHKNFNDDISTRSKSDFTRRNKADGVLEILGSNSIQRRSNEVPYFDASSLHDPNMTTILLSRLQGTRIERFPEKLYRMLAEVQSDGKEDIISFFSHGRAFGIHKPTKFLEEIVPKYFSKQTQISSFQRQLNIYGFTRINTGHDVGGYYHELFLRGRPTLSLLISRVGIPKAIPRKRGVKAYKTTTDPNFYSMPLLEQLHPS